MSYLQFKHNDTTIELTPEVIKDIRSQLAPQLRDMPFGELIRTVEAAGLSARNLVSMFNKMRGFEK